jgi:flagellar biosynthetic protein FlhB
MTALDLPPSGILPLALTLITKAVLAALAVLAVIAALDYVYQRQRFMTRHRMSRQELRDELKQSEGDPHVKARIRQIRLERARKRMIAAVPEATVVIVNPTHYAVALKYESGKMGAPVCVAKGMDHLALTIRKVAEENDVPVVENPPLARALYAAVEIDDEIPAEHYKAVAQVIGYVMRLAKQSRFWH